MELNWNLPKLQGNAVVDLFYESNFNSKLNFTFSATNGFSMDRMFNKAVEFNQDINTTYANGSPKYWNVSNVTNMNEMFSGAIKFNQPLDKWDVFKVTNMTQMFNNATNFNNGKVGYESILNANITVSSSSYTSSSSTLTCPGATLASGLNLTDVVIITTSTIVYAAQITEITDTTLTLLPAYTSNITGITSITKQLDGESPLTWDTTELITSENMFYNSTYFNQRLLAKNGVNSWNMSKVTTVSSMFEGTPTKKNLFNNGGLITDTGNPLNWTFNSTPTSANWHTNCVLTSGNAASNPSY